MNVAYKRLAAAVVTRLTGKARRNRATYWQGSTGLRILLLHAMNDGEFDRFRRVVDWCDSRFDRAVPEDTDDLVAGRFAPGPRDKLLWTFDDGHARDHRAAEWLAGRGIRAVFFVIPSYIDRSVGEFLAFHRDRGVEAHDLAEGRDHDAVRGLSRGQISEMVAMGHRIGAHNFAHRDLGKLHRPEELSYEIDQGLDVVSSITGQPCEDFAWGWGDLHHLSAEAENRLRDRCARVYSSVRGLNVPGLSPVFLLRDAIYPEGYVVASKMFIDGRADHLWASRRRRLVERSGRLPANDPGPRTG